MTKDGIFNDSDKLPVSSVKTIVTGVGFDSSPNGPIFVENVMQVGLDNGDEDPEDAGHFRRRAPHELARAPQLISAFT